MSGQSIMDRVQAARHSIAGQGLAKSVCKATTEQIIGPKKKHLDYLLQCTNEPNVSIPQLADLLIERTQQQNWVIVYKSLITIHNLMNYGNERFTQYLASNNCTFNLGGFIDKAGVQGYDMSTYIRRYAKYLNEKATSYRQMAFDFCKVKRGKDDGLLRTMNSEKLLKALPILQSQLNALIEFDCTPNELTNGVINACFMLLFKDLIRLFACYNDGIINLLEKYFDMNKKQCKEGLDIYKKFLVSMDKVSEFLKVAENVGIDRGDIPDLAKGLRDNTQNAPASLLDALEQHLQSLEGKKGAPPPTSTPKPAGFASALTTISNNSSALNVSEDEKKRILDEENQRLHQLKVEQRLKELQTGTSPTTSPTSQANPFNAGTPTEPTTTATAAPTHQKSVDLFGPNSPTGGPATNGKPSDDLLGLNANPFASNIETAMASAYGQPASQPAPTSNPFAVNTGWAATNSTNFGNEVDFASAFNNTSAPSQADVTSQPAPVLDTSSPPEVGGDLNSPLDPLDPSRQLASGAKESSSFGLGGLDMAGAPDQQVGSVGMSMEAPGGPTQTMGMGMSPARVPSPSPAMGRGPSPIMGGMGMNPTGSPIPGAMGVGGAGMMGDPTSGMMGGGMGDPTSGMMGGGMGMGDPNAGMMGGGMIDPNAAMMGGMGGPALSPGPTRRSMVDPSTGMAGDGMSALGDFTSGMMGGMGGPSLSPGPTRRSMGDPNAGMMGGIGGPAMSPGLARRSMGDPTTGKTGGGMSALDDLTAGMMGGMGGKGDHGQRRAMGSPALSPGPVRRGVSPTGFTPGEYGLPPSSPAHMARSTTPTYLESAAPVGRTSPSPGVTTSDLTGKTGFDAFGEVLQPQGKPGQTDQSQKKGDAGKLLAKDLDTSLSSLAGNLQIGGAGQQVKKTDHQWNPKGEHKLTGGTNWQPTSALPATTWNQQQPAGAQFQQQPMMGGPMAGGMGYGQPGMMQQPMMGMGQPQMMGGPGMGMGGMVGQPQMYGARMQQPMGFQQPRPPLAQQSNNVDLRP